MILGGPEILAQDFSTQPYWWINTPRSDLNASNVPAKIDVLIIGSGYTGLCAAIQTARAGRSTLVIDTEAVGWGCSSRNGGQVSEGIRPDFCWLSKEYGKDIALGVLGEGRQALEWIRNFISEEQISCNFSVTGMFYGAHTDRHFQKLQRTLKSYPKEVAPEAHVIPRSEQLSEVGTDFYHGGLVYRRYASLDPAAYHKGVLDSALAADAQVIGNCSALAVEPVVAGKGFNVATTKGTIEARDVILATSGYTGSLSLWHQRRVVPIGSYIIATEDLGTEVAHSLMPTGRHVTDTRRIVVYFRLSPDRRRLLFGGRVSLKETDTRISALRLHRQMITIFPQLKGTCITNSWMGFVGWTFSQMPHLGKHKGIWYSIGYCGSGISLASYFGTRLGQQVLGLKEGKTALDDVPFRTRPYYFGKPWFLGASVWWYGFLDDIGI